VPSDIVNINVAYPGFFTRIMGKLDELTNEDGLIYKDGGSDCKAELKTITKFTILTLASPLIAIARLIRSVVFICTTLDVNRSIREFIGGLATPLVLLSCLVGSLLSSNIYIISNGTISFFVQMRRVYAFFEAWINKINLHSPDLQSYSSRCSNPTEALNLSQWPQKNIWTTAPCMQPILEKGYSNKGGLLDIKRMKKIFPQIQMNNIKLDENRQVIIKGKYLSEKRHYTAFGGACEHKQESETCCCCYRIDTVYDRFLCCEVGLGTCTSLTNSGDSCGIATCKVCGIEGCCCYAKENGQVTTINSGCFGSESAVICGVG